MTVVHNNRVPQVLERLTLSALVQMARPLSVYLQLAKPSCVHTPGSEMKEVFVQIKVACM